MFYDATGKRIFRAVGYYPPERFRNLLDFLIGDHPRNETFAVYAARQERRAPSDAKDLQTSDPLFREPPYLLDRRIPAERPLLVVFERAGCADCRQFHVHVVQHPPVREFLAQYDAVRLDVDDSRSEMITPNGQGTTPAAWVRSLGIAHTPALVFFARNGREVLRFDSLVLRQRMERALRYVLDEIYENGSTYQQFTREQSLEMHSQARDAGS